MDTKLTDEEKKLVEKLRKVLDLCDKDKLSGFVDDIFPNANVKKHVYIIICESPGAEEVKERTPLIGSSGKSVANVLFNLKDKSIGMYCKDNKDNCLGIMNVFNYPLQKKDYGTINDTNHELYNDNKLYNFLERIRTSKAKYMNHTESILNSIEEIVYDGFAKRLNNISDNKYKSIKFVVCGEFAQKFFNVYKEKNNIDENDILNMPHPSYNQWEQINKYYKNFKYLLRKRKKMTKKVLK